MLNNFKIIPTIKPANNPKNALLIPKIGSIKISKKRKLSPNPNKIVGK